jgi:hypothetical protein
MNFHEKILKCQKSFFFLVQMWNSMHLHHFSWKNIEMSKFFFFLSSDVRFNAHAWIFMKKYKTFKVLFLSLFGCEIQCTKECMNFHEKILNCQSSFFFLVHMWDSMHLQEFSWKNINLSKFFFFLSSDVRFNALEGIFMKKYWTFKVLFFS